MIISCYFSLFYALAGLNRVILQTWGLSPRSLMWLLRPAGRARWGCNFLHVSGGSEVVAGMTGIGLCLSKVFRYSVTRPKLTYLLAEFLENKRRKQEAS